MFRNTTIMSFIYLMEYKLTKVIAQHVFTEFPSNSENLFFFIEIVKMLGTLVSIKKKEKEKK